MSQHHDHHVEAVGALPCFTWVKPCAGRKCCSCYLTHRTECYTIPKGVRRNTHFCSFSADLHYRLMTISGYEILKCSATIVNNYLNQSKSVKTMNKLVYNSNISRVYIKGYIYSSWGLVNQQTSPLLKSLLVHQTSLRLRNACLNSSGISIPHSMTVTSFSSGWPESGIHMLDLRYSRWQQKTGQLLQPIGSMMDPYVCHIW